MPLLAGASSYIGTVRGLGRNVWLLFASQGLVYMAMMGVAGLLENLFLVRLGFGAEFIGLVWAASMLGMMLASVPAAEIGARITMRRAMVAGMALTALLYAAYSFTWLLPVAVRGGWLLAVSLLMGGGFSLLTVNCTPFLMGSCTGDESTHAFSLFSALTSACAFVGSLLGGILPGLFSRLVSAGADDPVPYGLGVLVAAVLFVPGTLLLLRTREPRPLTGGVTAEQLPHASERGTSARPILTIAVMSLVALLCWLGQGTIVVFWNLYFDEALHVPTALIGTLYGVSHLVGILAALATPLIARRLGNWRSYVLSMLATAACMLPLALAGSWLPAGGAYVTATALLAITVPTFSVTQQSSVSPRWRGRMSGAMNAAETLGLGIAALGGGYAINSLGYRPLFLASATLIVVGVVVFWALGRASAVGQAGEGAGRGSKLHTNY